MHHTHVKAAHDGIRGHFSVNGTDLSYDVSAGLAIKFPNGPGEYLPRITVDLHPGEFEFDGEAVVHLSEKAEAALVALGWTPPSRDDERTVTGGFRERFMDTFAPDPVEDIQQQTQEQTP